MRGKGRGARGKAAARGGSSSSPRGRQPQASLSQEAKAEEADSQTAQATSVEGGENPTPEENLSSEENVALEEDLISGKNPTLQENIFSEENAVVEEEKMDEEEEREEEVEGGEQGAEEGEPGAEEGEEPAASGKTSPVAPADDATEVGKDAAQSQSDDEPVLIETTGSGGGTKAKDGAGEVVVVLDSDEETGSHKQKENSKDELCWHVKLCPVQFFIFTSNREVFQKLIRLSTNFEYRMSKLVSVRHAKYPPFFKPNNKSSLSFRNAVEMKVSDSSLVEAMKIFHSLKIDRKSRVRIEMRKIGDEEAQKPQVPAPPASQPGGETQPPTGEGVKEDEDPWYTLPELPGLQVNACMRTILDEKPAFSHEPGHKKTEEDSYIYLQGIPDEVTDNVIKAIFQLDVVERTKEENQTTSKLTLKVKPHMDAQRYMEKIDFLINMEHVEMHTTLSTKLEASKKLNEERKEKLKKAIAERGGLKRRGSSFSPRGGGPPNKMMRGARGASGSRRIMRGARGGARGIRGVARGYRGTTTYGGATRSRGVSSYGGTSTYGGATRSRGYLGRGARGDRVPVGRGASPRYSQDMSPVIRGQVTGNIRLMHDLEAKVMATHRDLAILQEQARITQMQILEEREKASYYQSSYSRSRYDNYSQADYPPSRRRRPIHGQRRQ